jgi:UPF0042 nucleotide-binding protein
VKVTLFSFGFKHGYPEADFVFDMRFLPNPYWVPELKSGTGCDPQVALYVLSSDKGREFFEKFFPLLEFILEEHHHKGRDDVVIAIGCTGGRHRSVAVVEHIGNYLREKEFFLQICHKDIDKD